MPQIIEHTENVFAGSNVDESASTLRNVTLLGRISRNGRIYSEQAMTDAERLYEGAPFYLDHPTARQDKETFGVRSVKDLAGKITNPRRDGDMIRGDVVLLEGGPFTSQVIAIAKQMPDRAGNSHRVLARTTRQKDGPEIVEGIDKVFGMELVTEPATTGGLFESEEPAHDEGDEIMDLKELREKYPELVKEAETKAVADAKSSDDVDARIAAAEARAEAAEKRADDAEAKQAAADHATMVAKKLDDADLPDALVTDYFKESLENAADESEVDALIADRKTLVKAVKSPKIPHREKVINTNESNDPVPVDDDSFVSITEKMFK